MEIYVVVGGVLDANSFLLVEKEGAKGILIDAGCSIDALENVVSKHASGLSAVLLTHGHFDHIAAVGRIKEQYGAKIYIHKDDASMLTDAHENMSDRFTRNGLVFDEADVLLSDGDQVDIEGIQIKVMHTPGHSMGSSIFLIENNAFAGDTLFKGSIGRYDFPHSSFQMLTNSLNRVINEIPKDTVVFSGHGPSTTIEHELNTNPFLNTK